MIRFSIADFNKTYPDDDTCLKAIWQERYGNLKECPKCKRETTFHRISTKKVYGCKFCGHQISPTAGTIFHKSSTSLKNWFYAIYLFANSKNGVSAKELERQLGVSYKTAHRVGKMIRILFGHSQDILSGVVEVDETYIGGKRKGKRGRGAENKTSVLGMLERKGNVVAKVTTDTKRKTVMPLIRKTINIGTRVMTDEYRSYHSIIEIGYKHQTVQHGTREYVRGDVHTNSIEGFWSQLKRSVNETYHAVSPAYLQSYVDEFSYRYNARNSDQHIFHLMLDEVLKHAL